jgi:hypothetical protein
MQATRVAAAVPLSHIIKARQGRSFLPEFPCVAFGGIALGLSLDLAKFHRAGTNNDAQKVGVSHPGYVRIHRLSGLSVIPTSDKSRHRSDMDMRQTGTCLYKITPAGQHHKAPTEAQLPIMTASTFYNTGSTKPTSLSLVVTKT